MQYPQEAEVFARTKKSDAPGVWELYREYPCPHRHKITKGFMSMRAKRSAIVFYFINFKKIRRFLPVVYLAVVVLSYFVISAVTANDYDDDDSGAVAVFAEAEPGRALIIDPGHGGEDGGAVSLDSTRESEINLDIATRLQMLALFMGEKPVMTRDSEIIEYPESANTTKERKTYDQKRRAEIINSYDDAIVISIHQNKYPEPGPNGSQVLYAATDGSKELAELTHANMVSALNPANRRVAAPVPDSIYLMKSIKCPGILVECGFLSNEQEAQKLADGGYRLKLASVILASYLQYGG